MIDVLIFKDENESVLYKQHLLAAGFNPKFVQVLEFQFDNLEMLYSKLLRPNEYSGIIFTSARGVEASKACLIKNNPQVANLWCDKSIYVVGEKTETAARNVFAACNMLGSFSGNADALANIIISNTSSALTKTSYLFPCGSITSETLPNKLRLESIDVDSVVVYKTLKSSKFESTLKEMTSQGTVPKIFIVFSPSGVEYIIEVFKSINFNYLDINFIAIGPVTGERVTKFGCKLKAISAKPNPECLVDTLKSAFMNTV